ncbi:MAG: TRAP transporter substrate-binding protein [Acetobacteraceae bacterium]
MIRRLVALPIGFVVLAVGVMGGPVLAQQRVTLKLSHFLAPSSFLDQDFAQPWAREIEARSDGKVKVEIYDGTSGFGDVTRQATQVKDGTVDIALGLRSAEGDRFMRSSIVELPFAVPTALDGSRALWRLYQDGALGDEYGDYKLLALFVHNPPAIHTRSKRITLPGDLIGERLVVPNEAVAAALRMIGGTPVILPAADVMPAVRSGSVDGILINWGHAPDGLHDHMRHHTTVALYSSAYFLVMNRQRYLSLSAEIRAAINDLSGERLVVRFGLLWNKWDRPVREDASASRHEMLIADEEQSAAWRNALLPTTDSHLKRLTAAGFADAPAIYQRLQAEAPH